MEKSKIISKGVNIPIQIYADGSTLEEMRTFDRSIIRGYTFNPSLFRKLNIKDYLGYCWKVIDVSDNVPVSLEVIADEQDEMIRQARILSELMVLTFC